MESDMKELEKLYREYAGEEPGRVVSLSGSASNRKYCRLEVAGGGSLMGVVGTDAQENRAFITLAGHFKAKGINVPEVMIESGDGMRYLQEDLGNDVLGDRVAAVNKAGGFGDSEPMTEGGQGIEGPEESVCGKMKGETVELLCKTMAALPKIQFEGAQGLDFNVCYPQPSFDRRMVMFDLNYFKYCFLKPSGLEFNEIRLQDDFGRFADDLLTEQTDTFLYRDFNARNVMIKDGEPYFIDFQGGRRGPIYYDVASFIWQARAKYPQWLKEKMLVSYLDALKEYQSIDRGDFDRRLNLFILFRTLQVLGAYGFRGLIEHKAQFVTPIPQAVANLRELLPSIENEYTYLHEVLTSMTGLPKFSAVEEDGRLEVKVYSFSYKKGIPEDMSGNGGGYVFDCRYIHNPGRYEPYRKLTGRDREVIDFLEDDGEIMGFLKHVYGVVDPHVETYAKRGFTSLMVSFGCTGGQHRSVYCAEHLAHHLAAKYPDIRVRLIHREQGIEEVYVSRYASTSSRI